MNYRITFSRITLIVWSTIAVIFVICSITLNRAEAVSLFNPAVNYGAGDDPSSVAIGDLNGDGKLDLAVANAGSDNVSVLLGNGDGSFQGAVNYATCDWPLSISIGDLNGDSNLDLATANIGDMGSNQDSVSVLFGSGDGTFQDALNFAVEREAFDVAIGDLNEDGNLDLAVTAFFKSKYCMFPGVWLLLGYGDGTFQDARKVFWAEGCSVSTAIGDLNGDGRLRPCRGE